MRTKVFRLLANAARGGRAIRHLLVASLFLFSSSIAAEVQVLRGQLPSAAARLQPVERLSGSKRLDLAIALPLRNRNTLTNLLRQIYDPASPDYRRYLTPGQFAEQFGPTEDDYRAVIAFAKSNRLTVTATHPNRTLLDVRGSAADIENAFQVNLRVYQHATEARTFHAPDVEPSLNLAVPVLAISGLDDFAPPRPMGLITNFFNQPFNAIAHVTGSGPRGYFVGKDFRAAYAPGVPLDGAGQSVGLVEFDGYFPGDIATYQRLAGLPAVPVTTVLANGGMGSPGPNNVEVALDINMAISMAPGLSKVIVYQGYLPNSILNRMATDNEAKQLSSSWGFGPQVDPAREQIFMQYAAQGQSFFQASCDWGAWAGPVYSPSDDAFVTVVGGTSLTTSELGGNWLSETTWAGSGGGISTSYSIPFWQQGVSMTANQGSTTMRNIPDVACLADVVIWLIANNGEHGIVGGTSASAPLWAGFTALVNQQAAAEGKPSVGFINPALYAIGQGSGYGAAFHDITTGNNTNSGSPEKFFAESGYDLCTGWGTPTGSNLIHALLAPADALRITPATTLTFVGPPGGPFNPAAQIFSLTNDGATSLTWMLDNAVPWLDASPSNGTLTVGGPAATVAATLAATATDLPVGSHAATLVFTNLNNGFGQTREVILEVAAPPVITSQPASQAVLEGMTATFAVSTATNATLSYQWRHDNGIYLTNLADGGNIFGSATRTVSVSNVSPANVGAYSVVVSNAAGTATSADAFLTIVPWRPVITVQPASRIALPGEAVTLSLVAVGSQPLLYQWRKDGANLTDGGNLSGATANALTLHNVSYADAGAYAVLVSNALGAATSSEAALSVTSVTAPGVAMTTFYSFTGGADGANPNGLAPGANGVFYGTTQNGGTNLAGSVFHITTNGLLTSLHAFSGGSDGANPFAALAEGPDGNFYGNTFQGGESDNGTIFRITPGGALATLFSFNITNGDFPYAQMKLGADGNFFGTSYQGGSFGRGTVYRFSTNGALATLYSFSNGSEGGHLSGGLVQGSDGNLYGTTYRGGAHGYGTVFRIATNGELASLISFSRTNGAFPYAGLAQGSDGDFYGVTAGGGLDEGGTVFRISPTGQFTNLHSFSGDSDGSAPRAALRQGADGNFYGTTVTGGDYGKGTVFAVSPDGALVTLAHFNGYNGANPQAALVEDADGIFYGTTQNGGASGCGTIFRFNISSAPQITSQPASLSVFAGANVQFSVSALGSVPMSYQWQKHGTNLTDGGDISGSRARVLGLSNVVTSDAGNYSVIVSNALGSATSTGALLAVTSSPPYLVLQPTNQTLAPGATATFNVTALGNLPLVYQWQKNGTNLTDGSKLSGSATSTLTLNNVTETNNGTYAVVVTNVLGSVTSTGAVLMVVPVSAPGTRLVTLHWFGGGAGRDPNGLALGADGKLYGSTQFGPAAQGVYGNVFSLTTNGEFSIVAAFRGTNGSLPQAALVQGTDGNFYGTTRYGGAEGLGTVFKMKPDGTLTALYSFADPDGGFPQAALVEGADGSFYGTTPEYGQSTVFRISPEGVFSNLHFFTGEADGSSPSGALLSAADGNLYGVTADGGSNHDGTVFRITPEGVFTTLHAFSDGTNGIAPAGALVQGTDGYFYGVTRRSTLFGFESYGTVFRLTSSGRLTTLHRFHYTDGAHPSAGLIEGSDGNFYGTTYGNSSGGINPGPAPGNGTVFRMTPDGTLTTLVELEGFNTGAHPESALVEGADASFYGAAADGGLGGRGAIFRVSFTSAPEITSQPASQTAVAGADVSFSVAVFGAPHLLYQWQKDGINLSDGDELSGSSTRILTLTNVSPADMGTYSVIVSNTLGSVTSGGAVLTVISPPVFQAISQSGTTITLRWSAMAGQKYQLQYNSDLSSTNWINLGSVITPTNGTVTLSDVIGSDPQRFYRVVLVP